MNPAQLRPFLWAAWIGVATTALNTGIPVFASGGSAGAWRDLILLVHAPATLLPVIAIALLGFRFSPFAAVTAIVAISLEKSIEFVGQSLLVFPPEEAGVAPTIAAVWDQLFFLLWFCNTVGAAAAALLMFRLIPRRSGWIALSAALGASMLTVLLLLGDDYVGLPVPAPGALLFFFVFTAYRLAVALTLLTLMRERAA